MKTTAAVLAFGALSARQVFAQNNPLNSETNNVCGFTLSAGGAQISRTNNWSIAQDNGDSALTAAQFWITSSGTARLFGGNGERCTFDPYLECDDDDNDNDQDNTPFTILPNNTLSFTNQSTFYLCARNAFTDFDDDGSVDTNEDNLQDYPYIYPPIGTSDNSPRNYQNCTLTTLVASRCADSGEYNVTGSAAASSGTAVPSGTASASASTSASATSTGSSSGSSNAAGHLGGDMAMVGGMIGGVAALLALM